MKPMTILKLLISLIAIQCSFFALAAFSHYHNQLGSLISLIAFILSIRFTIHIYKHDPNRVDRIQQENIVRRNQELKKKERIQAFEKNANHKVFCPECGCTDVQYVTEAYTEKGKQRTGKGITTALLGYPIAGMIIANSHKDDHVHHLEYCVCLKCGAKWTPQSIKKYLQHPK